MMVRISLPTTDDDLIRLSDDNPGWRIERLSQREVVMVPPTGGATGARNSRLAGMLNLWAEAHGYQAFDSSTGWKLPDGAVLSSDGMLVDLERWGSLSAAEREQILSLAPNVVVELLSQSDRPRVVRTKLMRMFKGGARYVIMVDPYRREVWTHGAPPPDFELDFTRLFA
jgi:Uma2 family endonuclease